MRCIKSEATFAEATCPDVQKITKSLPEQGSEDADKENCVNTRPSTTENMTLVKQRVP